MRCPACNSARIEQLTEGQICAACGIAFLLDADGQVVSWWTTNHSHPHGVYAAGAPIIVRRRVAS